MPHFYGSDCEVLQRRTTRDIVFPPSLCNIIIDDMRLINEEHMLLKLPARFTIDKIVEEV